MKLERKRERNRVAARNCRARKLQRIAELQKKVNDLNSANGELNTKIDTMRSQVLALTQRIKQHRSAGCAIVLPSHLQSSTDEMLHLATAAKRLRAPIDADAGSCPSPRSTSSAAAELNQRPISTGL